ncbi:hypothetical protein SAMN05216276_104271 [Streptosporangium subroseum]|uniref:Uncharacterized protein n=1 Tax=Streptosporangium subroseum TaxID=106412 RepID=A0A239MMU2_9ACTN|nr:hypothetical protein [Streptosporangium subroseum]SNT43159.1 hypothetical protein SAMN05216276_104271 [Streptosporangium subroseum]
MTPSEEIDTLLVPASGPWVKIGEAITFVRGVRPARAFPIHDIQLSKIGLEYFDAWLEEETDHARIPAGASVDLQAARSRWSGLLTCRDITVGGW